MLKFILDFFSYWWFRYTLVTEIYMFEKWERVAIHVLFGVFFLLVWCFNYTVLLNITGKMFGITPVPIIFQKTSSSMTTY